MSPLEAAVEVVCRDAGALPTRAFLDIALLGLAFLLAALPPELTVSELADHLHKEHA